MMDNEHPEDLSDADPQQSAEMEDLELEGYVLQREISRGGQAIIFSAIKKSTGRKVAIKFFPGGTYATRKEKVRMDREVRVLAALDHPNIVSVIDRGQTDDGSTYFVLEYVHGKTLAEYIDEYWEHQAPPQTADDLKELLHLFVRIADAVNAAHLRGVVHRDLKPSNIVIDSYGEPHVLDFGVALSSVPLMDDAGEPLPSVTWTGEFLGSVQWASPEQAEGDQSKVDVRSDVYSLGVILYELLTSDFPYDVFGTLPNVLKNIMEAQPRPPSEAFAERHADGERKDAHAAPIDPVLDAIVLKALEKKRENRYQTAGEFAKAISNYLAGKTVSLQRTFVAKRRWPAIAGGIAAAALLTAAVFLATRWHVTRSALENVIPQITAPTRAPHLQFMNLFGYRIENDEVVFEFDPRDYESARMGDGSLGAVDQVAVIQSVALAGEFNGWNPLDPEWRMVRQLRNRFELRKPLSAFSGRYHWPFKFVINENIWVSAPHAADNREVVIEDTATYNLLFYNPTEPEGLDLKALREHRQTVAGIWPGQEDHLVLDANGGYHLTLTHVDPGTRIQSLKKLAGVPLSSLNLGQVRVTDLEALASMTELRWLICSDPTYHNFLFAMNSALREGQLIAALNAMEETLEPFAHVPALSRTRTLLADSLHGMLALADHPDVLPETATRHEDRRYLFIAQPMTWNEARIFAEDHGAALASSRSPEMQAWLSGHFGWPTLGRQVWLGGTDEMVRGSWGWLSGDPWFYENWSPGYPDRDDERARATAMQYDGWWVNIDPEGHTLPFVIEWKVE